MKRLYTDQQGLTLIEITTATAIAGLLIIIIMTFAVNSFAQISIDSARSDLLREAEIGLDTATRDIRLSSGADDNNRIPDEHAPGSNDFGWASDNSNLVLAAAAQDQNHKILFEDPLHYTSWKNNVIYFVQNGTLYRRSLAADVPNNKAPTTCPASAATSSCPADAVLVNNVASFTVKYIDGNGDEVDPTDARSVELTLHLQATKYGQDIRADYTTRTVFRNE